MRLQIEAEKTRAAMSSLDKFTQRAKEMAKQIFESPSFSFLEYVKTEHVAASFSNLQKLSDDEKLSIIEKHLTLKLKAEDENDNDL